MGRRQGQCEMRGGAGGVQLRAAASGRSVHDGYFMQ